MKIKSFLSALLLMASTVASAQYLNVKLEDGTVRSFKTTPNMKVSFGDKAGAEVMESEQIVKVNGHTVTVKLADDTPASEVMLSLNVEGKNVKIEAFSKLNHGLWCSMDDNAEVPVTSVSNGFYTFALSKSNITNDVVVTVGYITVSFDINNSGKNGNFTDKPEDITLGYNTTITEPDRIFSDKYVFRGWYKDKECTENWDFSTRVTKSTTLYAKWKEDPTRTQINGHDFVKLGGYYWATENVGEVENMYIFQGGYGYYYNQANAKVAANTWNSESGGGRSWTLPSEAQWNALLKYCDWEWKEDYDYNGTNMNGMLVKGKADNYESDHSIFLPAAGFYNVQVSSVNFGGSDGYYWSTSNDRHLGFNHSLWRMTYYYSGHGMFVRPVSE